MPRRTLWMLFAAIVVSLACYERAERNPYGRWLSEVIDIVDHHYLEPVDLDKLFDAAVDGMIGKLDDHSSFFPRGDSQEFQQTLDQQYGGVGIEVMLEGPDRHLTVGAPLIGKPAFKAGIRAGDRIVAIDGRDTVKISLKEAVRLLRGKPRSAVAIRVRRGEESLDFHLVRDVIQTDSVLGDVRQKDGKWNFFLPGDQRLGYVRITAFGESTVGEFQAALRWLAERHCRGLILDLRTNPGGLLNAAEQVCDLFLPEGALIVTTRGRENTQHERLSEGKGAFLNLPLVVLVNDKSASASEVVAACLQDHHRATIVGQRTWGKATVQNVIPLEGGKSSMKLTTGTYWRPNGKNIHRMSASKDEDEWGVSPDPDCEVKLDESQLARWSEKRRRRDLRPADTASQPEGDESPEDFDPQLKQAVQVLEEKLAN